MHNTHFVSGRYMYMLKTTALYMYIYILQQKTIWHEVNRERIRCIVPLMSAGWVRSVVARWAGSTARLHLLLIEFVAEI